MPVDPRFQWWPRVSETQEQMEEKWSWLSDSEVPDFEQHMYWSFKAPDLSEEVVTEESEIDPNSKLSELPEMPILNVLFQSGKISPTDLTTITDWLSNWSSVEDSVNILEDQDVIDGIMLVLNFEFSTEWAERNLDNFKEHFSAEIEWDWSRTDRDNDILELLWSNYIYIPTEWWENDRELWLNTAFELTLNKYIDWKQFNREAEFFKRNEKTLRDPSKTFEERYKSLKSLIVYVDNWQWVIWRKQTLAYKKTKEAEISKKVTQQERYDRLLQLMASYNDGEEIDKMDFILELEMLKSEEPEWWEVFAFWDLDMLLSEINKDMQEEVA